MVLHQVEAAVLDYLRAQARTMEVHAGTEEWALRSPAHAVLEVGRLHTPGAIASGGRDAPKRCFANARSLARSGRRDGLMYAEGWALSAGVPVEHAWCVDPEGTVHEPTWPVLGLAYVGIAVADPAMWPQPGRSLLWDPRNAFHLLREGLPAGAVADVGRTPQQTIT